ncbi:hypothetical protein [Streptomyces sp. NPDC003327]
MSDTDRIVKLYAKGAPVGLLNGGLVALLVERELAAEWAVSQEPGGFRFTVKGTEDVIAADGTERAPVAVRPDDSPASVWRLQRVDGTGAPALATVDSLADLRTGTYVIDQHGLPLGRDLFEDRSLTPKPVLVRTDDRDPLWEVEVLA